MYNINYDYYRIFYYVAKYGNISQAAKMLMNNQPNLTRSIKNLEGELGCTLFVRSNRGMKLTPEGEKLYSHIRIALEHIEAGEEEISRSKNLEGGAIYVSASEVALNCCILPIFKKYRTLYPKVKIRIDVYKRQRHNRKVRKRIFQQASERRSLPCLIQRRFLFRFREAVLKDR